MSITFWDCEGREANFANSNAFQVLRAMGVEPDYCGEMEAEEFHSKLWHAIAKCDGELAPLVRASKQNGNLYEIGSDLSDMRRRVLLLQSLADTGKITWA